MYIYCVYLTCYSGNKLPPFYIGSTSVDKINKGYKGSVHSKQYKTIWKSEIKTSPNLFKTKIIKTFVNREEAYDFEEKIQTILNAHKSTLYINQCIANSKFSLPPTRSESHRNKISKAHTGKKASQETRKILSDSHKGKRPWMKGKHHSKESKEKISTKIKEMNPNIEVCCCNCRKVAKIPSIFGHIKKCYSH